MSQRISDLNVRNKVLIGGTGDQSPGGTLHLEGNFEVNKALVIKGTYGTGQDHYFRTHGVNSEDLSLYNGSARAISFNNGSVTVQNNLSVVGNTYLGNNNGDQTHINDTLYLGATDSGDSHFYFGENSSNWYGSYMNWDSGHRFSWYSRHAGTNTRFMYFDTDDTGYIHWTRSLHMHNVDINYVNQLHFNDNVRFFDQGNDSGLTFKSGDTNNGQLKFENGSGARTGVIYWDSNGANFGLLNRDGQWALRSTSTSTFLYNDGVSKLETTGTGIKVLGLIQDDRSNYVNTKRHSGSDFVDGTLVTTDIPANVTNGASFVLEATGKSYSANPPFSFIAQGYIYNNTIINYSGQHFGFAGFSSMKVFEHSDGNLAFWWPRVSYWNSFEVSVRDAGGNPINRVTNITNSTEPSSSKKVSIDMKTTWHSGNDGAGSGLDADKLDGYDWMQSGKSVRANEFYADNWFRNYNSGEGLYNENTGQHWYSDGSNSWSIRSNQTSAMIKLHTNGTTRRGSLYANSSNQVGILDEGGAWAIRHTNDQGTDFLSDGESVQFRVGPDFVSGTYGTVETKMTKGGWGGYSINGQYAFMSNHGSRVGIFNDANDEWMFQGFQNAQVELYYNGTKKMETTGTGINISGNTVSTGYVTGTNLKSGYQVLSLDDFKIPGLYTYDGGISGTHPGGGTLHNVRTIEIGYANRYSQIAMDYASDRIWFRRHVDSGWQPWRQLWHDGNFSTTNVSNWNTAYGWGNHSTQGYATQTWVTNTIVNSAPGTLDTLNELAAALGDDPNFATTVTNSIATKLPLAGGTLTGDLTLGDNQLKFGNGNVAAPSSTNQDAGTRINLFPQANHYSIGVESGNMWFNSDGGYKWYNDSNNIASLSLSGVLYVNGGNSGQWNTAYGWGNHASAGYLTSVPRVLRQGTALLDTAVEYYDEDSGGDLSWAVGADDRGGAGSPGQNAFVFRYNRGTRFTESGWRGEGTEVMTLDDSGNVGIGVPQAEITERLNVQGNVRITGTLEAAEKSFNIPHPTKEGKRLIYGVLEGPEHGVYVRGKSTEKVIELPEEWTGLVHEDNITVQLTCKGKPFQIWVEDIRDNKVYINTDVEDFEYYYNVQGERKDVDKLITERDVN